MMTALGHPDPEESLLQGAPGGGQVGRLVEPSRDRSLGVAASFLSLLEVDLGGHVRNSCQLPLCQPHLEKAADDGEGLLAAGLADAQFRPSPRVVMSGA